jgi:nicotinate-nucleotide adenylyltransferase
MVLPPQRCFYFGTFNPVHTGHLMIAQTAIAEYGALFGFEHVTFVPTGFPPHRTKDADMASAVHRVAMVQRAIQTNPCMTLSTIELPDVSDKSDNTHPQCHYTYQTLCKLYDTGKLNWPALLILGSDAMASLQTWYAIEQLVENVHFLQAPRPGTPVVQSVLLSGKAHPLKMDCIHMPPLGISSTWIRSTLAKSQTSPTNRSRLDGVRYYLPDSVLDYISEHQLYL